MKEFGSIPEPAFVAVQSTAITDLIAKLEATTGELSPEDAGRLVCAMCGGEFLGVSVNMGDDGSDELMVSAKTAGVIWGGYRSEAPDVSVDTALMLFREAMPGWRWSLCAADGMHHAQVDRENDPFGPVYEVTHASPALALSLAMLDAKATEAGT